MPWSFSLVVGCLGWTSAAVALDLGPGWAHASREPTDTVRRYASYPHVGSDDGRPNMSVPVFRSHLTSGEPFIVQIPSERATTRYENLDAWASEFSSLWTGEKPIMWFGRVAEQTRRRYEYWAHSADRHGHRNEVTIANFKAVRERFPGIYMSLVSNLPQERALLTSVFAPPSFMPNTSTSMYDSMWMYAGSQGAGVHEHIDTVGCVCSWSFMLLGTKRWWFRSPPGASPQQRYEVLQETGDFVFWCVGWHHQTLSESDEALDVHGYVALDLMTRGSFGNRIGGFAERATGEGRHGQRPSDVSSIVRVADQCGWSTFDGAIARTSQLPIWALALAGAAAICCAVLPLWLLKRACTCCCRRCRRKTGKDE